MTISKVQQNHKLSLKRRIGVEKKRARRQAREQGLLRRNEEGK